MNIENNVVDFEKRGTKPTGNLVGLPLVIERESLQPFTTEDSVEDNSGMCDNGVCVLAWKPRRPTAAA